MNSEPIERVRDAFGLARKADKGWARKSKDVFYLDVQQLLWLCEYADQLDRHWTSINCSTSSRLQAQRQMMISEARSIRRFVKLMQFAVLSPDEIKHNPIMPIL